LEGRAQPNRTISTYAGKKPVERWEVCAVVYALRSFSPISPNPLYSVSNPSLLSISINFFLRCPSNQDEESGCRIYGSGMNEIMGCSRKLQSHTLHKPSLLSSSVKPSFAGPSKQDDRSGCKDTGSRMNEIMRCSLKFQFNTLYNASLLSISVKLLLRWPFEAGRGAAAKTLAKG
jgi:hypothetical protein